MSTTFLLFDTVVLAQPDGYHTLGNIIMLPGFEEEYSVCPVPYYSVNFSCTDGQIENLWLEENEMCLAPPVDTAQEARDVAQ